MTSKKAKKATKAKEPKTTKVTRKSSNAAKTSTKKAAKAARDPKRYDLPKGLKAIVVLNSIIAILTVAAAILCAGNVAKKGFTFGGVLLMVLFIGQAIFAIGSAELINSHNSTAKGWTLAAACYGLGLVVLIALTNILEMTLGLEFVLDGFETLDLTRIIFGGELTTGFVCTRAILLIAAVAIAYLITRAIWRYVKDNDKEISKVLNK